jgi:hypothetical protein
MAELVEIRPKSAGRQDSLQLKPMDRRYVDLFFKK